ncbi:hypothetical protein KIPB_000290 [Kipferlia bialata]|uniref:Uncharacterized protein n=1 Tax=Kipferlia bialata TaxID=797122 RepID=A0A9K3GEK2_9EUKA|nr:hypothetical protein KIPB_000290 [Kipferlia bialata]|eukprot:g290.t1
MASLPHPHPHDLRTWVSPTRPLTPVSIDHMVSPSHHRRAVDGMGSDAILSAVRISDTDVLLIRPGYSERMTLDTYQGHVTCEPYSCHPVKRVKRCPVKVREGVGRDTKRWAPPAGYRIGSRVYMVPQQPIITYPPQLHPIGGRRPPYGSENTVFGPVNHHVPCEAYMHWYDLDTDTWHTRHRQVGEGEGEGECWPGLTEGERQLFPGLRAWVASTTGHSLVALATGVRTYSPAMRASRGYVGGVTLCTYGWEYLPDTDRWHALGPTAEIHMDRAEDPSLISCLLTYPTDGHIHVFSPSVTTRTAVRVSRSLSHPTSIPDTIKLPFLYCGAPLLLSVGNLLVHWGRSASSPATSPRKCSVCMVGGTSHPQWLDMGTLGVEEYPVVGGSVISLSPSHALCYHASQTPCAIRFCPVLQSVGMRHHVLCHTGGADDAIIKACLAHLARDSHAMHLIACVVAAACLCPGDRVETLQSLVLGLSSDTPGTEGYQTTLGTAWQAGLALNGQYSLSHTHHLLPWSWQGVLSGACDTHPSLLPSVGAAAEHALTLMVSEYEDTTIGETALVPLLYNLRLLSPIVPVERLDGLFERVVSVLTAYIDSDASPSGTLSRCLALRGASEGGGGAACGFRGLPSDSDAVETAVHRAVSETSTHWHYRAAQAMGGSLTPTELEILAALCGHLCTIASAAGPVLSPTCRLGADETAVVLALCSAVSCTPTLLPVCVHLMPAVTQSVSLPVKTREDGVRVLSLLQRVHVSVSGLSVCVEDVHSPAIPAPSLIARVGLWVRSLVCEPEPAGYLDQSMGQDETDEWAYYATQALSIRRREDSPHVEARPQAVYGRPRVFEWDGRQRFPTTGEDYGSTAWCAEEVGEMEVVNADIEHIDRPRTRLESSTFHRQTWKFSMRRVLLNVGHNTALVISYNSVTEEALVYVLEVCSDSTVTWRQVPCPFTLGEGVLFNAVPYGGRVWLFHSTLRPDGTSDTHQAMDTTLYVYDMATETWGGEGVSVGGGVWLTLSSLCLHDGRVSVAAHVQCPAGEALMWSYNLETGTEVVLPPHSRQGEVYLVAQKTFSTPSLQYTTLAPLEYMARPSVPDRPRPVSDLSRYVSPVPGVGVLVWCVHQKHSIRGCNLAREWDPISGEMVPLALLTTRPSVPDLKTCFNNTCTVLSYRPDPQTSVPKLSLLLWQGDQPSIISIYPTRPLSGW